MSGKRLLLLEDDPRLRSALQDDFTDRGYEVTAVDHFGALVDPVFDFAVVDLRLLGESGLSAVPLLREKNPQCKVVVLTGYGSVASAVEAMKSGAVNYLSKPAGADRIEAALLDRLKEQVTQNELPSLDRHEHEYIEFVLAQNQGNISRTAKQLGLHRQSLQRKLKKFP